MARHVNGRVGLDGPGEHPDQADPADVGVRRRLDHFGQQRPARVAGKCGVAGAVRGKDLGQRVFQRRREAAGRDLEQFERADAGATAHRDHREEGTPGDGSLQVLDQHRLVDLFAAEVALHQGFVLGLLDDPLDQDTPGLLDPVASDGSGGCVVCSPPSYL